MVIEYVGDKILVINDKKEVACEVGNTPNNVYFLENWYFIKANLNTDKYTGSFLVKYQ